jgi:hypothetical protein
MVRSLEKFSRPAFAPNRPDLLVGSNIELGFQAQDVLHDVIDPVAPISRFGVDLAQSLPASFEVFTKLLVLALVRVRQLVDLDAVEPPQSGIDRSKRPTADCAKRDDCGESSILLDMGCLPFVFVV